MKKLNQKGIAAVAIVLVIALVLAICGVGYYVWQSSSKTTKTTPSSTTESSTATNTSGYLVVKEWAVQIPVSGSIANLKAGSIQNSSYSDKDQVVDVLSPDLDTSWTCTPDTSGEKAVIGSISRTEDAKRSGPGEPLATVKVGRYTYSYEAGGENCTTDHMYQEQVDAFKQAFSKLSAN